MNKVKHIFWKGSPRKKVGGRNKEMTDIFLHGENERCTVSLLPREVAQPSDPAFTLYGYIMVTLGLM